MNNQNNSFADLANQTDLNSTRDDLEEERRQLEAEQEEMTKTNLFKTRVIETEINSSLFFQIALYFNYFYCYICFVLQVSSVSYKIYVYMTDKFDYVRIVLIILWLFVEHIRLFYGYKSNIQESFYHFMLFILVSILFVTPFQVLLIVGNKKVFPMDYATTIVEFVFVIIEIVFCAITMNRVSKRQSAVYYLRNTQTRVINKEERIKTSSEIEEELYIKFPNLRKNRNIDPFLRPGSGFPAPRSWKKEQ